MKTLGSLIVLFVAALLLPSALIAGPSVSSGPLPIPAAGATPALVYSVQPTPTAEISPSVVCGVFVANVATCTASNLNRPRQIAIDGTLFGTVSMNGSFTLQAPSGTHKLGVEGFADQTIVVP
jgi:curli biogenesis system outer membrane secretion channel CsgG